MSESAPIAVTGTAGFWARRSSTRRRRPACRCGRSCGGERACGGRDDRLRAGRSRRVAGGVPRVPGGDSRGGVDERRRTRPDGDGGGRGARRGRSAGAGQLAERVRVRGTPAGGSADGGDSAASTPPAKPAATRTRHRAAGQERHAEGLAERGHPVVVLRPGVIVGPGRRWTARLGAARGPLAVRIGGGAAVPLIGVADCGRAVVRAAILDAEQGLRAFNLVGDDTPTQRAYLKRIRGEAGLRATVPVPAGLIGWTGRRLHPILGRRLPGILRPAAFDAPQAAALSEQQSESRPPAFKRTTPPATKRIAYLTGEYPARRTPSCSARSMRCGGKASRC